jgi:hypothetical protein
MTGGAIRDNERAGIAVFQGEARVTGVDLDCNGIDLNVDSINGSQGELLDEGGNVCRCGQTAHACKVASSGLTPPQGP